MQITFRQFAFIEAAILEFLRRGSPIALFTALLQRNVDLRFIIQWFQKRSLAHRLLSDRIENQNQPAESILMS